MFSLFHGRFINARRRILQPMLDASNPDPAPKAKKIKSQHRPTQRFWPNSIAAGVLQQQGGNSGTNPDGKDKPSGPALPGRGGHALIMALIGDFESPLLSCGETLEVAHVRRSFQLAMTMMITQHGAWIGMSLEELGKGGEGRHGEREMRQNGKRGDEQKIEDENEEKNREDDNNEER